MTVGQGLRPSENRHPLAETPDQLRVRRMVDAFIVSLAEAMVEIDCEPYSRVRVECFEQHYDLIVERRRRKPLPKVA